MARSKEPYTGSYNDHSTSTHSFLKNTTTTCNCVLFPRTYLPYMTYVMVIRVEVRDRVNVRFRLGTTNPRAHNQRRTKGCY